jgi:hypothetical protein
MIPAKRPDHNEEKAAWERYCKEHGIDIADWPYEPFDPKRHAMMYPDT